MTDQDHDDYVEQWREIPSFPGYWASDLGRIWSAPKQWTIGNGGTRWHAGLFMKPHTFHLPIAYLAVQIKGKPRKVHRLVLEAFLGSPSTAKHHAAHHNGDGTDNRLSNLWWATPRENVMEGVQEGRHIQGARHPRAKLQKTLASSIRTRYQRGGIKMQELADQFDVSKSTIYRVVHGAWQ